MVNERKQQPTTARVYDPQIRQRDQTPRCSLSLFRLSTRTAQARMGPHPDVPIVAEPLQTVQPVSRTVSQVNRNVRSLPSAFDAKRPPRVVRGWTSRAFAGRVLGALRGGDQARMPMKRVYREKITLAAAPLTRAAARLDHGMTDWGQDSSGRFRCTPASRSARVVLFGRDPPLDAASRGPYADDLRHREKPVPPAAPGGT